jgi:hypothetical protein
MAEVPPLRTLPFLELIHEPLEIVQPLRFHTEDEYRLINRHLLLNYLNFVPLIADKKRLLPFTLFCEKTGLTSVNEITTAEVINYRTNQSIDLLPYLTFVFSFDDADNPTKQYIQYWDNISGQFPGLKQGIYSLHLKSADEEWWSDQFKVGYYDRTISFLYQAPYSFAGITISPKFYKATYQGSSYDTGEYSEHSVVSKDQNNYDRYSFFRSDKLRGVSFLGDSNAVDLIKQIIQPLSFMGIVYLIDEVGKTRAVEISEVTPEPVSRSNYLNIILKYRVKDNSINTSERTPMVKVHTQYPPETEPTIAGETFDGEYETFDGERQTFNNQ